MLDSGTRRRIDTARDVLVGKVPDPKSQVEQITIALIYKFMDDMDAEAEEFGGQRKFFAGPFERFGWAKLMRSGLGGYETLNLYAEAIAAMPRNPGIPPLFRDIFKNAYLPYRDPETLRMFLKVIDGFTYEHSESLGDSFEYLLSVMGSQGEAGQFRTPRHIIDFIVDVVDPKKNETILDPACGTAGFLISSYKHILAANRGNMDSQDGQDGKDAGKDGASPESGSSMFSTLTPDERGRLANNLKGYDISPDMVRLSLANMYLHGFAEPHIHEYDTLTSLDRWNEYADVILANPPFMSPKGGIVPHNRFSVLSKRSEVLFVDYMAEHLTPTGRAGIIVPEGVIFQSGTAYKHLRKMLVENYLVAVISLPAGVFNPYSGVKTSILILDKSLAKRTSTIGFFKVENDGFGLGAQRREIDKNDLPAVASAIREHLNTVGQARRPGQGRSNMDGQDGQDKTSQSRASCSSMLDDLVTRGLALIVPKEKIAANGDYNLSGERYRENGSRDHTYPLVRLGDICRVNPRKADVADLSPDMRVSFVPMADLNAHRMTFQPTHEMVLADVSASYTCFEDNDVLLAKVTPCFENGKAGVARGLVNGVGFGSSEFYVLRPSDQVLPEWVYFCVMHPLFRAGAVAQMTGTGGLQRVPRGFIEDFRIPLPPLEVQKEIVAEIEGYQKVIDGARAVVDNYRPHVPVDPAWPMVELGEVCEVKGGKRLPAGEQFSHVPTKHPYIRVSDFRDQSVDVTNLKFISEDLHQQIAHYTISPTDAYISIAGTIGLMGTVPQCLDGANLTENAAKLVFDSSDIDGRFLCIVGNGDAVQNQIRSLTHAVGVPKLALERIRTLMVPLPPLATQQAIVAEIEAERALVNANRELITRMEKKIQAVLARVWGQDAEHG